MTEAAETISLQDVLAILIEARRLLDELGWTQEAYARPFPHGPHIGATEPDAMCFCISGAIRRASFTHPNPQYARLSYQTFRAIFPNSGMNAEGWVISFNDRLPNKEAALKFMDDNIATIKTRIETEASA